MLDHKEDILIEADKTYKTLEPSPPSKCPLPASNTPSPAPVKPKKRKLYENNAPVYDNRQIFAAGEFTALPVPVRYVVIRPPFVLNEL